MGSSLKGQWGVDDPADAGSDEQRRNFQALFQKELGAINGHLQYTAAHAETARHDPMAKRRDALVSAFQAALAQIDPKNSNKAQAAIDRVLDDARVLAADADRFHDETEEAYDDWQDAKPDHDEVVTKIEALEAWEDKDAAALRTDATAVATAEKDRRWVDACKAAEALETKVEPVHENYLKQKEAKEEYDPALAELQPDLDAAMVTRYKKLAPMQAELTTQKEAMETAATGKDYVKALQLQGELKTKVETLNDDKETLDDQKKAYEDKLAEVEPRIADVSATSFRKLEPMQNDLRTVQDQMKASADAEDYEQAATQAADLGTKADAIETARKELDEAKATYEKTLEPLTPRVAKAAEATDEKLKAAQNEVAAKKLEVDGSAEAEEYERAVQLCGELAKKLDDFEKGILPDGVKVVVPIEKSFKLASPLKAKGAYCTFSAEMSIKLKGSLELPSDKKMASSADVAPLGYSDGLVMRLGETWYSKEGAQICGVQTTIVESKIVGEAKVKDGLEVSIAGSVKFANNEELKLKFVVVKVDEKDGVSGPGAELSHVFKSINGKIELDGVTFSGAIQLQIAGKAQPDYEAIGKVIGEKVLERGAQMLASITAAEAVVIAGAVGISVAVMYTAFSGMARGSEIRGLYPLSEKITNQMVDAYIGGFQGAGSPGGNAGTGHALGATAFNNLKKRVAEKVPDVTDAEIRDNANVASKRQFIWGEVNPKAKQAVWQAFAESNRGDKSMLRSGHVNLFGRMPGENDRNYTQYLDEAATAE